jgi:hypothetical protein
MTRTARTAGTKRLLLALLLAGAAAPALADDRNACEAAGGSFLTGAIVKGPTFAHGQFRSGVELSHTHLKLRADQDGRTYDVAIDNVFANGWQPGQRGVPPPLDALHAGQRLSLCGQLYDRGVGIHFVHTNCGATPSESRPDGWLRVLDARGAAGPNLEASTQECSLFQGGTRHRRHR